MDTLDIDAVRAFVLTVDFKSFTRAAEAMDATQSAVSLKVGRLERRLGRRLLERTPRLVRLSSDGAAFLPSARALVAAHGEALGSFAKVSRRLAVGISHHVVGSELTRLLRRMHATDPDLVVEIRLASTREVLEALDAGKLDAGLVLRHDLGRRGGEVILKEPFGWMAMPDFELRTGEPLRLATQAEPCSVRAMAIEALEARGILWTEVFVGGGVATIGAAVSAGLAVAALGRGVSPPDCVDVGPRLGLPPLPSRDIALYSTVADPEARRSLRILAASFRATRGLAGRDVARPASA